MLGGSLDSSGMWVCWGDLLPIFTILRQGRMACAVTTRKTRCLADGRGVGRRERGLQWS
jgi:hypothetical protein